MERLPISFTAAFDDFVPEAIPTGEIFASLGILHEVLREVPNE